MFKCLCLLGFLITPFHMWSQVLPKEGSALNYRLIGFSVPVSKQATAYKIEIALGAYNDADSFKKNICCVASRNKNKIVAEVPSFGSQFTWRVIGSDKSKVLSIGSLHHFSTMMSPNVDTDKMRLRVTKPAEKYKDAYVFLDASGVLYDMKGNPVWFVPSQEATKNGNIALRDIKMTAQKTITFDVDDEGDYEIDYNGNLLWRSPPGGIVSGDNSEHYHHEFTRLKNGHYMALAQEFQYWAKPASSVDSIVTILPKLSIVPGVNDSSCIKTPMGTLIEYDANGNIVWSWKSSDYLDGSAIFYRGKSGERGLVHAHENSFFFDERARNIYLSCRNLNCIIKLKYPEGDILDIYSGDNTRSVRASSGQAFFCGQHSCRISREGLLYLYNNNLCNPGASPSVLIMKEGQKNALRKIWEYPCEVDPGNQSGYPSGGNAIELPDNAMFVSMAYPDSKVFIVSRGKHILWNSVAEKWNNSSNKWESVNLFRASIIPSREMLEEMIWKAESGSK